MMKIRTFLAVELDEPAREALREFQSALMASGLEARWVKPENIHLTIRFLGEIIPADIEKISASVRAVAEKVKPFRVTIRGAGAFPSLQRPRVVWAGLEDPSAALELEKLITAALRQIGFPPEDKEFHPHFTLARTRGGNRTAALEQFLRGGCSRPIADLFVDHVALIKSDLKPTGPTYTTLERFSFCP